MPDFSTVNPSGFTKKQEQFIRDYLDQKLPLIVERAVGMYVFAELQKCAKIAVDDFMSRFVVMIVKPEKPK